MAHNMNRPERPPHSCPGGCGEEVLYQRLACTSCWWLLPKPLRQNITRNYRRDRLAHAHAVADALTWYADNVADGALLAELDRAGPPRADGGS